MIEVTTEILNTTSIEKPCYKLIYRYMIGDADGKTSKKVFVSLNNPFIELYISTLEKLKPLKGCWGVGLNAEELYDHYNEGHITKDELDLLKVVFKSKKYKSNTYNQEEIGFLREFSKGVKYYIPYSFLVFKYVELVYIDETGKEFNTILK